MLYTQTIGKHFISIEIVLKSFNQHEIANVSLAYWFHFLWMCAQAYKVTRSYSSITFSVLRNLHTNFHNGYTNLHSCQEFARTPFNHILELLVRFFFFFLSWSDFYLKLLLEWGKKKIWNTVPLHSFHIETECKCKDSLKTFQEYRTGI